MQLVVQVLLHHENIVWNKHVESTWFPRADEGSTPSSSTMKNGYVFYGFLMTCIFMMMSCEKMVVEDNNASSGDNSEAILVLKVSPVTRSGESPSWNSLMFVVYKDDKKVKEVLQNIDDQNFGTASISLTPDSYRVLILAHGSNGNPSRARPTEIEFSNKIGYSDTFYCLDNITVTSESQTRTVTLERATSKIEFVTDDPIPAEVKSIKFFYTGGSGTLNALTGFGYKASQQTVWMDVDASMTGKPLQADLYTILREQEAEVKLTVTTYSTEQGASTMLQLQEYTFFVPVVHHQISRMSGTFFTGEPNVEPGNDEEPSASGLAYHVTVNDEWENTNYYTY